MSQLNLVLFFGLFVSSSAFADACGNSLIAYCGVPPGAKRNPPQNEYVFSGWKRTPPTGTQAYRLPVAKSSFEEDAPADQGDSSFEPPKRGNFRYLGVPFDDDGGTGAVREGTRAPAATGNEPVAGGDCVLDTGRGEARRADPVTIKNGQQVKAYSSRYFPEGMPHDSCSVRSAILTCTDGSFGPGNEKYRYTHCEVGSEASMDHDEAYKHAHQQTEGNANQPKPVKPKTVGSNPPGWSKRQPSSTNKPVVKTPPAATPNPWNPGGTKPGTKPMTDDEFEKSSYWTDGPYAKPNENYKKLWGTGY